MTSTSESTAYQTWIRCDICGAIIFDKEGPREFARPDQAERCKGACKEISKP